MARFECLEDRRMLSNGSQPLLSVPAGGAGGDNPNADSTFDSAAQPNATTLSPHVAVTGNNQPILNGSTTPSPTNDTAFGNTVAGASLFETYTISNTGTAPLTVGNVFFSGTNAADFTIPIGDQPSSLVAVGGSTSFTVQFTPTSSGTFTATVNFAQNDPSQTSPFTFAIDGVAISTKMTVTGGNQVINYGSTTPSGANATILPNAVVGKSSEVTYAIANSNTAALTLGTVSISGTNAADFTVTKQPSSTVAAGGFTTFTVQFTPTAAEDFSATVSFADNSPDQPSPFIFAISGLGVTKQPQMTVTAGNLPVADGSQTGNGTTFPSTLVGNTSELSFAIANNGTAPLTLGTVSILGTSAGEFTVTKQPSSTVPVGQSTTFTVQFKPTTSSAVEVAVSFDQNDPNLPAGPFQFGIFGVATTKQPQINVTAGDQLINNGSTTPSLGNGTAFPSTVVGSTSHVTYEIANNGTAPLTLGTVSISGTNAGEFTVTKQPSSTVAAGGSTSFTVQFKPTTIGTPTATINFAENDPNQQPSPFNFAIGGAATDKQPLMTVTGGTNVITDGSTMPSPLNATSFSSTVVGTSSRATYSIANSGTAPLTLGAVSISGTNAGEFTVTKQPSSTVAAGSFTSFTVQFTPTASGTPAATVSFAENDPNQQPGPFTFDINGVATAAPIADLSDDVNVADITAGGTTFGSGLDGQGNAVSATQVGTNVASSAIPSAIALPSVSKATQSSGQPTAGPQLNDSSLQLLAVGATDASNQASVTPSSASAPSSCRRLELLAPRRARDRRAPDR